MQKNFHPPTLISVELFIIRGPLSSSERCFSLSLSCCSLLCQYQTRWKHKAQKNSSWHWLFQLCSTFCLAKLSTREITKHLCVISTLAGSITKPGSADAPAVPYLVLSYFPKAHRHHGLHGSTVLGARSPLPKEVTSCFHCLRWAQSCSGVMCSWEKWSSMESHWGKRSRRNDSALNLNSDTNE